MPGFVANNGLNAGIVLPSPAPQSSTALLCGGASMAVCITGCTVASGGLWPLPAGHHASPDWLQRHVADHGTALSPGHVVLAGTPLGLYPVAAGDRVAIRSNGHLAIECIFS